jgi:hypothetical protein
MNNNIGFLVRFASTEASFWSDKNDYIPDFNQQFLAKTIQSENEYPLAMVIGADFTGVFVRILWGQRVGWVRSSHLTSL